MPENAEAQLIHEFFALGEKKVFARGEVMRVENAIYLLEEGFAGLYQDVNEQHKRMLFVFCHDDISPFPYQPFALRKKANLSCCALTTVKAQAVSREDFEKAIENNPRLGVALFKRFAYLAEMLLERISNLEQPNAFDRLVSRLLFSAKRFGVYDKDRVILDIPLTHTDIALSIGVTRETVNRFMSQLAKSGEVEVRDRKIIISESFLKK